MKKIISLILLSCLSLNTLASTGTVDQMATAFDNYQFAMTVDWDQRDKIFFEAETEKFRQSMNSLISEGLTTDEVLSFAEKKMGNKMELAKLQSVLSGAIGTKNPRDVIKHLMENSTEFYKTGASWDGSFFQSETFLIIVGVGIIILAASLPASNYSCYDSYCDPYYDPYYDDYYYY